MVTSDLASVTDVITGGIHGLKPDRTKVGAINEGRMWTVGPIFALGSRSIPYARAGTEAGRTPLRPQRGW